MPDWIAEIESRPQMSLARLIGEIHAARGKTTSADALAIVKAIQKLRQVRCLPQAYVDGIQDELLRFIDQPLPAGAMTSVYLAFHGIDNRAAFMKAGVAANVRSRMKELYTGNPLPRLWTFTVALPNRNLAYRVEAAIHDHLRHTRTSGEWFQVHGLSHEAAVSFVESLSELVTDIAKRHLTFALAEV